MDVRQLVVLVTCDDHVTDAQDIADAVAASLAPALVTVRDTSPLTDGPTEAKSSTFVSREES